MPAVRFGAASWPVAAVPVKLLVLVTQWESVLIQTRDIYSTTRATERDGAKCGDALGENPCSAAILAANR